MERLGRSVAQISPTSLDTSAQWTNRPGTVCIAIGKIEYVMIIGTHRSGIIYRRKEREMLHCNVVLSMIYNVMTVIHI